MSTSSSKRKSSPDIATAMTGDVNTDDAQQFQQIIRDRKGKFFVFKVFQLRENFLFSRLLLSFF
jgi:hypothetical protein